MDFTIPLREAVMLWCSLISVTIESLNHSVDWQVSVAAVGQFMIFIYWCAIQSMQQPAVVHDPSCLKSCVDKRCSQFESSIVSLGIWGLWCHAAHFGLPRWWEIHAEHQCLYQTSLWHKKQLQKWKWDGELLYGCIFEWCTNPEEITPGSL